MQYNLHEQVLKCEVEGVKDAIASGCDLNELDNLGNSPLHWAVLGGYLDIVTLLLEAGADPNVLSDDGITPKWSAVDFGLTDIEQVLSIYGGKINTDENFDRTSWTVFKNMLGQSLPEEDK